MMVPLLQWALSSILYPLSSILYPQKSRITFYVFRTDRQAGSTRMYLCRFHHPDLGARLGLVAQGGLHDITARWPTLAEFLRWSNGRADPAAELADLVDPGAPIAQAADADRPPAPDRLHLLRPTDAQEIWAAGVTYERSRVA